MLVALQQVEDQLAAQRLLAVEQRQQSAVVRAAEVSLKLAQDQYRAGTAPYLNVLSASNVAAQAGSALLTLQQRRYVAAVALVQALGGGWSDDAAVPR
ncbi:outer membrane protein OprM precursor [mine drainage metagenome]|uniref:Outer membrane protein OprM n=1 Tax=mine drainage metagenome TaxID=410659 RepID=A0A1J5PDX3_9ZZZZ